MWIVAWIVSRSTTVNKWCLALCIFCMSACVLAVPIIYDRVALLSEPPLLGPLTLLPLALHLHLFTRIGLFTPGLCLCVLVVLIPWLVLSIIYAVPTLSTHLGVAQIADQLATYIFTVFVRG
jgi:hypothetical protein